MKFTTISALFTLSAASGALAAPMTHLRTRTSFSTGAAYFMTNNPTGNAIITADIGSDGMITLAQAYNMSGSGLRGNSSFAGPDALFSQGAVRTHVGANLLAAVNPGSNSLSLFSINPETPSELAVVGMPISSGGHFPMSVAFNSAGNQLCALNSGEINGVQCFSVDATNGLAIKANTTRSLGMDQTTPPTGPTNTASQLIFSEDDSSLLVAVKGVDVNTPGYLAMWDVLPDGSLSSNFTRIVAPAGGAYPFSLTPIPGQNAYLSADFNVGVDVFDITSGSATVLPISGQGATCWTTYSPRTGNYYASDTATGNVAEIALAADLTPSLVAQYPFQASNSPIDLEVASLGDNDYMYIMMPGNLSIGVMSLSAAGNATALQVMDLAAPAAAIGVQMSADYVAGLAVYVRPQ